MKKVVDFFEFRCSLPGTQPLSLLQNLSLELYEDRICALIGESGSGKTTTGLSLLRLHPFQTEGKIFYHEQDLLSLSEKEMREIRGNRISMIFQDPQAAFNPVFPVGDQILEAYRLHHKSSIEEAESAVCSMLEKVQLPLGEKAFQIYPHQLSGGMKQRAMIAMALITNPDVLIADEPTTALDLTIQKEILELIKEMKRVRKMAVLLISHDIGVVQFLADDVAVLYGGEIMEYGMKEEVCAQPLHPYTRALFQARPHAETKQKRLPTIKGVAPSIKERPSGCPFHPRCEHCMEKCKRGEVPFFQKRVRCWLYE